MASLDDALVSQMHNIETATGRPFTEWVTLARASEIAKHGQLVAWLKAEHGFGHGNANLVANVALKPDDAPVGEDLVDAIYAGPKAGLRPLHDHVVEAIDAFGSDVEHAPKQAYVSLRRHKQFATVGPGPRGTLEVGLNLPGETPVGRLEPTTGMCTHRVRLTDADGLDEELVGWLRTAYDRA